MLETDQQKSSQKTGPQKLKRFLQGFINNLGNLLRQIIVCLFCLGLIVGSALGMLWLYKAFFVDNIITSFVGHNAMLIVPGIVAGLLVYVILMLLLVVFYLGIILLWDGLTNWETLWYGTEEAKKRAKAKNENLLIKKPNPRKKKLLGIGLTIMLLTGFALGIYANSTQKPTTTIYGVDFGPYTRNDQKPNSGTAIDEQQIKELITKIKDHTQWVRTYGCTDGLELIGKIAHEQNLKVAAGAWLSTNLTANQNEISKLIAIAKAGQADVLIVGSETLLRNDLTEHQLIDYIKQVKNATSGIPVATADAYLELLAYPAVVAAGDIVLPNIHPYWEGTNVSDAVSFLNRQYQELQVVAGNKQIIISETGWPSAGNQVGDAVPSPQNAAYFFLNFASWAKAKNVAYFYFEAFDETWKAADEGLQGANWGIWYQDGTLKPGMQDVFDGKTVTDNWSADEIIGGPGKPSIQFTSVPSLNSNSDLSGQVLHVGAKNYQIVVFIKVGGGWWIKPTFENPSVPIETGGKWVCDITTGPKDSTATEIAAYLIPIDYTPPLMSGQSTLPTDLEQNAAASCHQTRAATP
jgi:exo-beta-1,3-glucanase (GH17 family)